MTRHIGFRCSAVFAILVVVATAGNLRAGTLLWGDDFSVDTPTDWDEYLLVDATLTVAGGELAFSGGAMGPYGYPSMGLRLVDEAQLAPIEDVTVTCMVHLGTPDEDLYLGPVARANIVSYTPMAPPYIEGAGYGYLLSGYDRGGAGNGEAGLYLWLGTEDQSLLLMGIPDTLGFTDADVYMKLTARTITAGVQLDCMMSLSADFSDPFGVISYLHDDAEAMLDNAGQAGVIGFTPDDNDYGLYTGTLDDFAVSKPSGPGDANDDNVVDLLDLG
ncbi:MAG: hypothetical protein KJ749_05255, partial [Planctomycetes bacterium]|nr:hypothetical protein [Planctomycetota bacterium]